MPVSRRDLLRVGAVAAVAVTASACRSGPQETPRATRPAPSVTQVPPAGPALPDFPGRPPPGSLYYGASVPFDRSVRAWERDLGTNLSVHRSYFTQDHNETAQLIRQCSDDLDHGRLPHVSIKPASTWQEVATGQQDAWLSGILEALGEWSSPVFLTVHHEPENDAGPSGMTPSHYVAMQRRVIQVAADLAPQTTIVPVLQHWTFDPLNHTGDPAAWVVPGAAVIGVDLYNPWSPTNGKPWRTFGSKADEVIAWVDGTPLVIGEYGCRDDPQNPGLAAAWLRDAADYAMAHDVVSMSYFNSPVGSPDGSWELGAATEKAFAELLASDWVARPA